MSYIKYCHKKFLGRNGAEMFDKLEERINEFMESNEGANISYQLYNKDQNSAFVMPQFLIAALICNKVCPNL